ncbi:hypothetical protein BZA05DRAFT_117567 [Tricharina praecox]|uniref:uncharacterized protein n=1 Tax=Tricharina praecox TaxID=43433 RepID=UPI00221F43D7|nr:uncharacterized protein BZA05DRAFT_117567 [Tricharina praecox]KAI5848001.1 hypothetical protein BZA05DRAFT_117567 [Tricharina praecox]
MSSNISLYDGLIPPAKAAAMGLPDDNRGPLLATTTIALSALALLIVSTRVYGRAFIMRILGRDDYCIVIATMIAITITGLMAASVPFGLGNHIWLVGYKNMRIILKYSYIIHILYILGLGFARASLVLQLIRLAPSYRMCTVFWVIFGFTATCTTLFVFLHTFLCGIHPQMFWMNTGGSNGCLDYFTLQSSYGVVNILMDFVVWLAPLKIIWQVRLPWGQKYGLAVVFALGALVWIAAIVRLIYALRIGTAIGKDRPIDPSYNVSDTALWMTIEIHVGIMCSSIPTLRPAIRKVMPRLLGSSIASSSQGTGGRQPPHLPSINTYHSRSGANFSRTGGGGAPGIPLESMFSKSDDCSSSTERFAGVSAPMTTDIEGNYDDGSAVDARGDLDGLAGIVKRTEVRISEA